MTAALALAVALLATAAAPVEAGDVRAGLAAYERGDFTQARRIWRPLAEAGDAQAQYNLGVLFDEGRGRPADRVQARLWWLKAAEQGLALAQHNLASLHIAGDGVPQDFAKALHWLKRVISLAALFALTMVKRVSSPS